MHSCNVLPMQFIFKYYINVWSISRKTQVRQYFPSNFHLNFIAYIVFFFLKVLIVDMIRHLCNLRLLDVLFSLVFSPLYRDDLTLVVSMRFSDINKYIIRCWVQNKFLNIKRKCFHNLIENIALLLLY